MMYILRLINLLLLFILLDAPVQAQTYLVKDSNANATVRDYKASMFGIKSNGITLNTNSIQKAIDFISNKGGGRLVFYVGRYLTGSVLLRSNVVIHLEEGAVLVAPESIYNYSTGNGLITARALKNSGITGKGVIEGSGLALVQNIQSQADKGFLKTKEIPALVQVDSSQNFLLTVQNYIDVAGEAIKISNSSKITIDSAAIRLISPSTAAAAISLSDNENVKISNTFIDSQAPFININGKVDAQLSSVVTVNGNQLMVKNNRLEVSPPKDLKKK